MSRRQMSVLAPEVIRTHMAAGSSVAVEGARPRA